MYKDIPPSPACEHVFPTLSGGPPECGFCFFLVCCAATQLATPLQQRRIQVVRSNKVARKRLAESNDTPAMDWGWRMGISTETVQKKISARQSDQSSADFVLFCGVIFEWDSFSHSFCHFF